MFGAIDPGEIVGYVRSRPTGKFARRIWFFYEFLRGERLPLPDLRRGTYVDALDPDACYTASPRNVSRQRIRDSLPGDRRFCPTIRRTESLAAAERADLPARCRAVLSTYPPGLLRRALSYLYTKETRSSFEIERIEPGSSRIERFVALLQSAERDDFCTKERLLELQNQIVDPRFRELEYRRVQNYVGETPGPLRERVHYVCPAPEHLPELMDGLIDSHRRMGQGDVSAVAHAAAIAYGFVFLHPFEDGNGRIHRFLIHNILARRGFTPEGIMFPVSAAMSKDRASYDASLEAFSRPLLEIVDYTLDEAGRLEVPGDHSNWYRYIDFTAQVEALYGFIRRTIETELVEELAFLASYDRTKRAIQDVADVPDREIDRFISCCLENGGRLSKRKRGRFDFLSDEEVARMEAAVRESYDKG